MRVLDASFLVDYLDDVDAATEYVTSHASERFIVPRIRSEVARVR